MEGKQELLARRGLTLPRRVLRRLDQVGIFVQPRVSLEHQSLAKQYVVRGVESGGAIKELGRYVTFCGPEGGPIPCLHPIDAIGVNGVHAAVVAPILVRIEIFRAGRTYQLLITRHEPGEAENGRRPPLESTVVFRGANGFLECDVCGGDRGLAESVMPQFWSRGGEVVEIPTAFAAAVRAATRGACCIGCSHPHYLGPPVAQGAASLRS